jgi:hypothetical protein
MNHRATRALISVISLTVAAVFSLTLNSEFSTKASWCEAEIDYSAANEYVATHYGDSSSHRRPYFGSSIKKEPVFDARHGVLDERSNLMKTASIDFCGFALRKEPTRVTNWTDLDQIRIKYLPELRAVLQEAYSDSKIRHIIFWNPMLRGENLEQTRPDGSTITPTAGYGASPHIDMDIGAYASSEVLATLFEKNKVDTDPFPRKGIVESITKGRRFAVVNAWRNIAETPVTRSPLALFFVRYDQKKAFPEAAPNMDTSRWYTFPNMTNDEVLLFCQYDRDVTRPSDLWHCALTNIGDPTAESRKSFDVRCFIVFDEHLPVDRDRYGENRLASLLTLDQSGCFCDAQAARRKNSHS